MPDVTIVALASYFKGNAFLERLHALGARVILLTVESRRHEPWSHHALAECHVVPDFSDLRRLATDLVAVTRRHRVDAIVALDDFDVEVAAFLREKFRVAGPGVTAASYFRDKLAMRERAQAINVRIPAFVAAVHDPDVVRFLAEVPGPWLVKPRGDASAAGIRKCHHPQEVWDRLDVLGANRVNALIEEMVPGRLFHVDSLVAGGKVVFTEVNAYWTPLLDVYHGGEVYATRTLDRGHGDVARLTELNRRLLAGFGLESGASHTEFMRADRDGEFYFIETSCRVGGAETATMVEAATGVNLWGEWAAIEVARLRCVPYHCPTPRGDYGGVVLSLARTERPETGAFTDPEVVHRVALPHHIGFVLKSTDLGRIESLLDEYRGRILRDHHARMPAAETVMG